MRYKPGCKFKLRNVWYVRFGNQGAVRLGTTAELPTKRALELAARPYVLRANSDLPVVVHTVSELISRYKAEALPGRASTMACYLSWIEQRIEPQFGRQSLDEFGHPPAVIQEWLKSLPLSTKSKREIKNIILQLVRCGELWGWIERVPNLSTVRLPREKGETVTKARVLPLPEFQAMRAKLGEPFRTMASLAYFHGLRVSELFGLKWRDVNWLEKQLELRQAVVAQVEDIVKTPKSEANHPLTDSELEMLKVWRLRSEFTKPGDYIFASPFKAGELPYSYRGFMQILELACSEAGIERITTHSFRHSLRARLKASGASAEVVVEIMRHTKYDQSRQYGQASPIAPAVREVYEKLVKEAV